jgi:signal peptidase I
MAPALPEGGLVLVGKLARPQAGDIVLMRIGDDPERYFKRVLAVGGEEIAWQGGGWTVDGRAIAGGPEQQLQLPDGCAGETVVLREEGRGGSRWWASAPAGAGSGGRLPEGQLFVAGDWREASRDSRHWGPVSLAEVDGVALVLLPGRRSCPAGGFPTGPRRL